MSTNAAILELAKQLAALQEENKALKGELTKAAMPKRKGKKQEQFERVSKWVEEQYAKGWEKACKNREEEIKSLQATNPAFVPVNDCKWPAETKKPGLTQISPGIK